LHEKGGVNGPLHNVNIVRNTSFLWAHNTSPDKLKRRRRLQSHMRFKQVLNEVLGVALALTIISSLVLATCPSVRPVSAVSTGLFSYEFLVDKEGFTTVNITYTTAEPNGSSWVLVPKFSNWVNHTAEGSVTDWSLRNSDEFSNGTFYFYEVLFFSFKSDGQEFVMNIQFNFTTGAMIIEPDGIFYSPQIGFKSGNGLKATVIFPSGFRVNANDALAFGNSDSYGPSSISSTRVVFDNIPSTENLIRIEIGFNTGNQKPKLVESTNGTFTFETVSRYAEYARSILNLYNRTYNSFVDLFNVTLKGANVQFYLPDFASLLSEGGYTPFTSNTIGDIYINFAFTRFPEGYIEVIALHELVHHFLWRAGISPQAMLWFHEGMAQYVSMEIADKMGYEGAEMMIKDMTTLVSQLKKEVGEDFGYLEGWSMTNQPQDPSPYYAAAYYIVSSLAENHGGLAYYASFFKLINGKSVTSDTALCYYLSLTSEESVAESLDRWGFNVPDLYVYAPLLENAKKIIDEVNPLDQPYKYLAELLYEQALSNARQDSINQLQFYLTAAISVAKLAPLLTLITISGILFVAILLVLKSRGVFWNY
jgi:hypothetical protein